MRRRLIPDSGWYEDNEIHVLRFIAFIIILIIALLATGYADRIMAFVNPDIESCKHGRCKDSCNAQDEIQRFQVDCIDSSRVCCVPKEKVVGLECNGLRKGEPCGDAMLCNENQICVSRCEYCSRFPEDAACIVEETLGTDIQKIDSAFSCGCTESECQGISDSGLGTCVTGFCPHADSIDSDFMCCNRP